MLEAKRENTRCGLGPMSDKAASQKTRSPEGRDENGPAAALLLSHVSIQICSFVAPCRRPILIATPLYQSRTWCTRMKKLFCSPLAEVALLLSVLMQAASFGADKKRQKR